MIRLLLSDLRHHAGSWAWTAVVAVVALAIVLVVTLSTLAHAQPVSGHDDLVSPTSLKEAL